MKPYYSDDTVTLYAGDCLDALPTLPDASVDAVVCDPPYGLEFMGKEWDAPWKIAEFSGRSFTWHTGTSPLDNKPRWSARNGTKQAQARVRDEAAAFQQWCEQWTRECLRVLKPGGHLLAFGGTRTYHRMVCAIEDAGFEIRDSIHWIYGSGFPKSQHHLKPAHEPIVVARKPLAGTVAGNVLEHGTGALNIGATRVPATGESSERVREDSQARRYADRGSTNFAALPGVRGGDPAGRWPTNLVFTHSAACGIECAPDCPVAELDRESGHLVTGSRRRGRSLTGDVYGAGSPDWAPDRGYEDAGGASRYFPVFRYGAKAPASERPRGEGGAAHVTVKPLALVRWLVRLVTPPGGVCLDPFLGSGTTAEACVIEGVRCIGIELDPAHLPMIKARLSKPIQPTLEVS